MLSLVLELTMVHRSVDEVCILLPSPSVPSMESHGGEASRLCVRIQTLDHQHAMLQAFAAIGLPCWPPFTATMHTL